MSIPRVSAVLVFLLLCLPGLLAASEPRRIKVGFNLVSVPEIQDQAQTFTATCAIHLSWHDPALVTPGGKRQVLLADAALAKADEIGGRPGLSFVNETTAASAKHAVLTLAPDGTVEFDRDFEVTLRSEFDLHNFPFDREVLKIEIESFAYTADELILEPIPEQMTLGRIRLPQWRLGQLRWATSLSTDEMAKTKYHRLTVTVDLARKPGFYVWQVFVPLFILLMIATTVFFLPVEDLSDRIGVITTSLLTAVALSYTVHQDLPKISYLTAIDRLFVTAYVFLGAKIAGMLLVRQLAEHNAALAKKIDRVARWIFPCAYLAANTTIILLAAVPGAGS